MNKKIYFEHCNEQLEGIAIGLHSEEDTAYFITEIDDGSFMYVAIELASTKAPEEIDNMEF